MGRNLGFLKAILMCRKGLGALDLTCQKASNLHIENKLSGYKTQNWPIYCPIHENPERATISYGDFKAAAKLAIFAPTLSNLPYVTCLFIDSNVNKMQNTSFVQFVFLCVFFPVHHNSHTRLLC